MAHVSNEEYLQRWEDAAPTPVDSNPSPDEIKAMQRPSKDGWWESYDQEMTPDEDPALIEAMADYASRVSDAEASSQTKDELARLKEGAAEQAKDYQWLTPEEYKNEGDRVGRIMHAIVFLNLLKRAGVNCWYRSHPQAGKVTLVCQKLNIEPEVGCWCQLGFAPELSVMRFDDHGVPLAEKYRGWRTSLLQLILKGFLSQEKAEEVFGKAPTTPAFHRYNATLQSFRNQGNRLDD
jgi:hypothetical protein